MKIVQSGPFYPPPRPGMETDPWTSEFYPAESKGDDTAHRVGRRRRLLPIHRPWPMLSDAFLPVTHRPRLPCPLLSPALGFLLPALRRLILARSITRRSSPAKQHRILGVGRRVGQRVGLHQHRRPEGLVDMQAVPRKVSSRRTAIS